MRTSGIFKTKSHFLDDLKSHLEQECKINKSTHSCEACGFHKSIGQIAVTDERDNSSCDIYICDTCFWDIKNKRNDNLMVQYSLSQVLK